MTALIPFTCHGLVSKYLTISWIELYTKRRKIIGGKQLANGISQCSKYKNGYAKMTEWKLINNSLRLNTRSEC